MRRIMLPLLPLWALALAQTCQVRYTPPDYPELPFYPPSLYLTVSPSPLTSPGSLSLQATTSHPEATAWVRVRWQGGQLATRDVPTGGYTPLLTPQNPVQGCPQVSATTRPLGYEDNGQHTFVAEALVYWREQWASFRCRDRYWDGSGWVEYDYTTSYRVFPSYDAPGNCQELANSRYWTVQSQVVSQSQRVFAYQSWEQSLSYDQAVQAFANRLLEDHRRATASMQAYAYAKEIPEAVRSSLSQVARGYFYDCNWLGICQRADPAGEIKILTDVPSVLTGLLYTGRLCGGLITFCFGAQNSRGADIGPKVEIKTFLMVKGWRHDYLLLDRLIPRRYYDPSDQDYPGVPEEERRQVLEGCRTYKDTQEGRRCLALVEVPTGIVPTLKTLLMIDPMFQRGRQYP